MPATPTTKSQVQAYRFVLRRMESALVRKDPVMIHEPMRTHLRAGVVGLIIGALALAGFFVYGFLKPREDISQAEIVVGKQSGAMYVVVQDPLQLIPVTNLASARLLIAAWAAGGGGFPASAAEVTQVEDAALADAPRTALAGIPGAPDDLPTPEERVGPQWAVCDTADVDPSLPSGEARPKLTTTALIGVPRPGRALPADQALLVVNDAGQTYLVFNGRRARVDLRNSAVQRAFRLTSIPRRVSVGLLNAIPESRPLDPPTVPGDGAPAPFASLARHRVGSVVRIERAGGEEFFLIQRDGVQRVNAAVADLIRFADANAGAEFPTVPAEDVAEVPQTRTPFDFAHYPSAVPAVLPIEDSRVACLAWSPGDRDQQRTAITVADDLPLPKGMRPVKLAQADGPGDALDEVFLPPGRGAVVRSVVPGQDFGTGTIFLVTDQGVKFGVPSVEVARALGLGERFDPAPEAIVRLLPTGPALDPQAAVLTFDRVPADGSGRAGGG